MARRLAGSVTDLSVTIRDLATTPARVVGRYRSDIRTSIAVDDQRFGGSAATLFLALTGVAVAYPILASIAHAIGGAELTGNPLTLALRPAFDVVYAESLPFMLAALGLGLFSPALGVLFMTVFIPADLVAANGTPELANNPFGALPYFAILARAASYGLLWILAVEIPLQCRRIARGALTRAGSGSASARYLVGHATSAVALVFLWATALPLLIMPVFTWSLLQQATKASSDPTWDYWPILVAGAGLLALLAARFPRSLHSASALEPALGGSGGARTVRMLLLRQTVAALVAALLLGALMTTWPEVIVVIGGLLVAGPGLTVILPRLPSPLVLARARPVARWTVGLVVALAVPAIGILVLGKGLFATDYLLFSILLVAALCVFRLILDAGRAPAPTQPA